ncbi:hypothetical protein V6N13_052711 [Hibiscus sabdariffa]
MAVIGRAVVEEINPEKESKSEPLSSSGNEDPSSDSDGSGFWTTNSYTLPVQWKNGGVVDIDGIRVPRPSWKAFSYSDLAAATDNFSPGNLLGKGGNAEVYKGQLADGQVVAVKKLTMNEKEEEEEEDRASDFLLELGIIAHINHPNATRLIGFGVNGGLHLVLQFAPHGSLASRLFGTLLFLLLSSTGKNKHPIGSKWLRLMSCTAGSDECLDWKTRYKVATGIAEGLKYLHHDCPRRFIHRDITASNILLTQDYEARISDFGLAKWLPENWSQHIVHPIEGTFGYLAPEHFMHGIVNEKTNCKPLLEKNQVKELVDPRLEDNYDQTEVKRAMLTASLCINHSAKLRPSMKRVVELLKNEDGPVEWQQKGCGGEAVIVDGCDLQDYTRTSYLNDLNRKGLPVKQSEDDREAGVNAHGHN